MAVTSVQTGVTGTADFDLALKAYAGEVLAEFENRNVLLDITRSKTMVAGAKSVQFPALGAIGNKYHAAGDDILRDAGYLQAVAQGERLIFADRENLSPIFLDSVEERISHWGNRQEYAQKQGHGLAKGADQMIMRVLGLAAADAGGNNYTGSPAGFTASAAGAEPTAAEVLDYLLNHQEYMDDNDVPEEDRWALVSPSIMRLMATSTEMQPYIDRDFETDNGSLAKTVVMMIAGFRIKKITHMPTDNYILTDNKLAAGVGNSYVYNATKLRIISFQREAVGTARAADLSLESEYQMTLRGDVLVAAMQMGHGVLRPECAGTLSTV